MNNSSSDWVERRNARPYFVCHGCKEAFSKPEHYSKEEDYCIYCFKRREAIRNDRCMNCGGAHPIEEYWGVCERCWQKDLEEIERENDKIARREAKRLGISIKEYEKRESKEL